MNETNYITNQSIILSGVVVTAPECTHEIRGEKFYELYIRSYRRSETCDTLRVTITDRVYNRIAEVNIGEMLKVKGEIRSFNKYVEELGRAKTILSVFAKEMLLVDPDEYDMNDVHMCGYLCKKPVHRTTPRGREITDILVAVNRGYGKSDYIPCVVWGRNAQFVSELEVGTKLDMEGRFQSREYQKRISEDESITMTAYEMSASTVQVIED